MQEREEAIEYLEESISKDIRKKIEEKTGEGNFHLDVADYYDRYEDFDGEVDTDIISDENEKIIGKITFLIEQNSFTLSELNQMMDAGFDDFVKNIKITNYEIY
jgi:hypothetical protein